MSSKENKTKIFRPKVNPDQLETLISLAKKASLDSNNYYMVGVYREVKDLLQKEQDKWLKEREENGEKIWGDEYDD